MLHRKIVQPSFLPTSLQMPRPKTHQSAEYRKQPGPHQAVQIRFFLRARLPMKLFLGPGCWPENLRLCPTLLTSHNLLTGSKQFLNTYHKPHSFLNCRAARPQIAVASCKCSTVVWGFSKGHEGLNLT